MFCCLKSDVHGLILKLTLELHTFSMRKIAQSRLNNETIATRKKLTVVAAHFFLRGVRL